MVLYVALIAILNLGLGYALARYVDFSRTRVKPDKAHAAADSLDEETDDSEYESEYESDDEYAEDESDWEEAEEEEALSS